MRAIVSAVGVYRPEDRKRADLCARPGGVKDTAGVGVVAGGSVSPRRGETAFVAHQTLFRGCRCDIKLARSSPLAARLTPSLERVSG